MGMIDKLIEHAIKGDLIRKIIEKTDKILSVPVRRAWSKRQKIEDKKIVFMTYSNKYECNPKYIAEELIRREYPCEIVWIVAPKGKISGFPPQIVKARRNSLADFKARATAKIWVDNSINFTWDLYVPKKSNQVYINTWHGSMGLKRVGKEDQKNKKWVRHAIISGKYADFVVSDSDFENNVFRETYWGKTPILQYGHARNDILFETSEEARLEIRKSVLLKLNVLQKLPEDRGKLLPEEYNRRVVQNQRAMDVHYVLYAPTFRDDNDFDCYNIDFERLIDCLHERFGGTWKVLMRFHFHNRKKGSSIQDQFFINATGYPDMQELMCAADIGITDYSSWICDFVLTGKPGFIYATDRQKYDTERGLYYPLETTPFPIAENNDELANNIMNFDAELYEKRRIEFLQDKGCVEDGHAAERVADKIIEIMEGGGKR